MAAFQEFPEVYGEVVDYLAPLQTVYEQALYHILLRKTHVEGRPEIRVGHRTLARMAPLPSKVTTFNKGSEIRRSSLAQIKKVITSLAGKRHIEIGDTTFEGTLYKVKLPREIPECLARIQAAQLSEGEKASRKDFYNIPANRLKVFERDNYHCRYCGVEVTTENATLDHLKLVSAGGDHSLENLVTCCLKCNAIKGARTADEPLLALLDRYKERVLRSVNRPPPI